MNQQVFNSFMYLGLLFLICPIGVMSNLLLLITLSKHNVFGHTFYSFLSAIAVLDLASFAFTVPSIISRCQVCNFGDTYITEIFAAFILVGIDKVFIVSSSWTVLALAFDCCLYTCKQDNTLATRLRVNSPWLLIFCISMVSIVENLPTFWYYKLDKGGRIGARKDHETAFYIYSWADLMLTGVIYLSLLATLCGYLIWWYIHVTGDRVLLRQGRNKINPVPTTPQQNHNCKPPVKQQLLQLCSVNLQQQQQNPESLCSMIQQQSVLIQGEQTNGDTQPGCSSFCSNQNNPNKSTSHPETTNHNPQQTADQNTTLNNSTPQNVNAIKDKDYPKHTTSSNPIRNTLYYSMDQLHTAVKTVIVLTAAELMALGPGIGLQSIAMQQGPTPSEFFVYQTITMVLVALIKSLKVFIYFGLDTQFRQACKMTLATTCRCFLKVKKTQDNTTLAMTTSVSILGSRSSMGTPSFPSIYHTDLDHLERPSSLTGLPSPRDTIQFFREHAIQEAQIQ